MLLSIYVFLRQAIDINLSLGSLIYFDGCIKLLAHHIHQITYLLIIYYSSVRAWVHSTSSSTRRRSMHSLRSIRLATVWSTMQRCVTTSITCSQTQPIPRQSLRIQRAPPASPMRRRTHWSYCLAPSRRKSTSSVCSSSHSSRITIGPTAATSLLSSSDEFSRSLRSSLQRRTCISFFYVNTSIKETFGKSTISNSALILISQNACSLNMSQRTQRQRS